MKLISSFLVGAIAPGWSLLSCTCSESMEVTTWSLKIHFNLHCRTINCHYSRKTIKMVIYKIKLRFSPRWSSSSSSVVQKTEDAPLGTLSVVRSVSARSLCCQVQFLRLTPLLQHLKTKHPDVTLVHTKTTTSISFYHHPLPQTASNLLDDQSLQQNWTIH